jgi:glutamyl-tRNA synthetase
LYAKGRNGKFLVRVEDTDRERSTDAAVKAIFDGLSWLELIADEEPVFQFSRADRHRAVVNELLERGGAYRDFTSAEETGRLRDLAKAERRTFESPWRDREPTVDDLGQPHVVRFRRPLPGKVTVEDEVQGTVSWSNDDLDDLVLLRSDGAPTYNLAVVVDDHDMGVTHIIRGDDHLTNGARQKHIYEALGWNVPVMAHIPLIHGPDGAKLSKRHGALGIEAYRAMGYLPAAMRNYLVRLGWAHGDQETFSTEEMVAAFDLPAIGRAPARLDLAKLDNLNGHYIRGTGDAELITILEDLLPHIAGGDELAGKLTPELRAKLLTAMPGLKERAKTLIELFEASRFLWASRPLEINAAAKVLLTGEAKAVVAALLPDLEKLTDWTAPGVEAVVRGFAESTGAKLGAVAQPLRAALTGKTTSPPIFDVLAVLGRDESLARLRDVVAAS